MIKRLLVKILNGTLGPLVWGAEAAVRKARGLPAGAEVRLTPTQLAWDAYLRRRGRRAFSGLKAPGVPGLVSLVLPVHNGERYLREAIDSVLAQRYAHFELIVVDDGSTDGTAIIIQEYAARDERVRALRQERARLPGALNAGFAAARGEFLTWTSDDNRLRPEFLEKMVAALREDPGADMLYADYDLIGEDGALLRDSEVCARLQDPPGSGHVHLLHDVSILNLINGNYVGGAFLYRARVPYLIGEYSRDRYTCEDYDFALRVNGQLRLKHAPFRDCVYEYRLHGGSLTARKEELEIARRTETLMAFDDYRRDLAAQPVEWVVRVAGGDAAAAMAGELAHLGLRAGDRVEIEDCRLKIADCGLRIAEGKDELHKGPQRTHEEPRRKYAECGLEVPPGLLTWNAELGKGTPGVWVYVTDNPQALGEVGPDGAAEGLLKVLVFAGAAPLPAQVDVGWDLCLAIGGGKPAALGGQRGWLVAGDAETAWQSMRVRAQSDEAARAEEEWAAAEMAEAEWAAARRRGDTIGDLTESGGLRAGTPALPGIEATVVIATTGRREKLAAAVRSVCRQALEGARYEIIVVNNAPEREDLGGLIEELRGESEADRDSRLKAGHPNLRLVLCPIRGMSRARNAGLRAARGRIVAFIDDDAIAESGWLENLVKAFREHPEFGVIGGAIRLKDPEPRPAWWSERARIFWGNLEPEGGELIEARDWREFPWGGNWAARREVMLAVGGFRCRYGRGGPNKTGEDVVAGILIKRLGWKVGIEPRARVIHDVDPDRFTLRALARTICETFELTLPLELDFYMERPAHWPRLVWQGLKHLRHGFYAIRKNRFEGIESFLFAWTHVRLGIRQVGLELGRWRRGRQH